MIRGNFNKYDSKWKIARMLMILCLFANLSFAQKVSSDDLLKQAIRETNVTKNYPKAIILAKKGLAIDPDYTDIRLLLGRLFVLNKQPQEAEIEFSKILIQKPRQKDALNYLINLQYQQKKVQSAIDYASRYLKYYPKDKNMQVKKTAMLYENGQYVAADMNLQNLRKQYPTDHALKSMYIDAHLKLANQLRKQNETGKAIAEYQKVLMHDTSNKVALTALYNLNIQTGNNDKALHYASQLEKTGDRSLMMSQADLLRKMKRYDEALLIAGNLRKSNPKSATINALYKDILYAKAKDHLNQRDTLTAYRSYQKVLLNYPADTFSRNQLINLSVARNDRETAVKYIDEGARYYKHQQSLQLKKIGITKDAGDQKKAYELSKTLAEKYPQNEKIRSVNDELFTLTRQNRVGLSYGLTAFDQQGRKPWNLFSVYYMRTEKAGSLVGRINYADRNDARGYQFELEAYPKHKTGYSYANVAYSNAIIFPKLKLGYSYFLPFSKSWEAEVGGRYLKSYLDYYSITAGLGKYFGNVWLNAKTFITPNGNRVAGSYILSGRYLLNDSAEDYVTAIAGYGFSPDDRGRNFEITERLNLQSVRFTVGYQRTLWKRNIVGLFGTWNNQEYLPGRKRNEFDAQVSFQHKF